ncbi:MAG: polyprenyl synthetase [Bacteroidetes bacterium CG12_big_fil_rev_8_21_14_0_65_60_17]|nr:MAG: polyprenyl synthetase [Bacteroidetes bacterium CG12_big_fil_rev_8_21_14_0_65_60_17]
MTLKDIQKPVAAELEEFRTYFRSSMRSDVRILDLIVRYLLRRKGKQLRPTLVLLSARACGQISEATYQGAALVELLHTATLVHDDVVDDADRRRGVFSINALWKNKIAVLMGDFLLSRGLLLALDAREYDLLHVVSDAVRRMSEGELLQIEKSRKLDIDEETYFRIISDKTASLLSACTRCGAVSARADAGMIDIMSRFGEQLGLAFQIRDDLFDFGQTDVGKPLGIDIREKKMTLPLIHALREAPSRERRRILSLVGKSEKSNGDVADVTTFVEHYGGLDYARARMAHHAGEALRELESLPSGEARTALDNLVRFTVSRTR